MKDIYVYFEWECTVHQIKHEVFHYLLPLNENTF